MGRLGFCSHGMMLWHQIISPGVLKESPRRICLGPSDLSCEGTSFLWTSGSDYWVTWHHIAEKLNPHNVFIFSFCSVWTCHAEFLTVLYIPLRSTFSTGYFLENLHCHSVCDAYFTTLLHMNAFCSTENILYLHWPLSLYERTFNWAPVQCLSFDMKSKLLAVAFSEQGLSSLGSGTQVVGCCVLLLLEGTRK